VSADGYIAVYIYFLNYGGTEDEIVFQEFFKRNGKAKNKTIALRAKRMDALLGSRKQKGNTV